MKLTDSVSCSCSTPEASASGRGGSPSLLIRSGFLLALCLACSGCTLLTVADAAVSVAATTVKVGATVVGTAVDVTAAGVRAVAGSGDEEEKK